MTATVVIAPDSFKGTVRAAEAAARLAAGWARARPGDRIRLVPMADGGEGTVDAFLTAVPGAQRMPLRVTGPEAMPVEAAWALLPATPEAPGGTAVVELASTSGIELLGTPARTRPLDADTRGFGEAIAAGLAHGVSRLVLGIGSSASTDGGMGMLRALGARFEDASGRPVRDGGRGLADLATVDLSGLPPLPTGGVQVLTDVTNPLLGTRGSAEVFGPQKGATAADIRVLEAGLARYADLLSVDPATPGAGAAGGTGVGLLAWGASLSGGAAAVAELVGLSEAIAEASFVLTGEGSFDAQSAVDKVPAHVVAAARSLGVPVALVAGRITADASLDPFDAVISLVQLAGSSAAAMASAGAWLERAGESIARAF